jgi:hypothetical protein
MRQLIKISTILLVTSMGLANAGTAAKTGAAAKTSSKPAATDVTDDNASMATALVYTDDLGNIYAFRPPLPNKEDSELRIYFGDGKAMYLQPIIGRSSNGTAWDATTYAPRAKERGSASLESNAKGEVSLLCREDHPVILTLVPAAKAKQVLSQAVFRQPLHNRKAQVLARDDEGTYYYVDRIRELDKKDGLRGFKVYVGKKGEMKEVPMTNVVSDSAGEIYATKTGELKIVTDNKSGVASWRKGKDRVELTKLDPQDNRYLIARELGIYGKMGYICEDE